MLWKKLIDDSGNAYFEAETTNGKWTILQHNGRWRIQDRLLVFLEGSWSSSSQAKIACKDHIQLAAALAEALKQGGKA